MTIEYERIMEAAANRLDTARDGPTAMPGAPWRGPLFIIGMPRSGTKLLRALLCQHESIRVLEAETEFLPSMAAWIDRQGPPLSESAFQRLYEVLRDAPYFTYRRRRDPAFDWRAWRAHCGGRYDVAGLFEGFARYELGMTMNGGEGLLGDPLDPSSPGSPLDRRSSRSEVIWADKSPAYIRHVPLLLKHFPQARIVHLIRDVRDQCASSRRAWGKDVRRSAARWASDVLRAHRQFETHGHGCMEIRFEDLLRDTNGQMRQLCGFLGVEFSCALSQLQQPVERLGNAAGRSTIMRSNFHTYQESLTPREIEAVESLAWGAMQALGYRPELARGPRRLHTPEKQWLRIKDGMHLLRRDVGRKGWVNALRFHVGHVRMLATGRSGPARNGKNR